MGDMLYITADAIFFCKAVLPISILAHWGWFGIIIITNQLLYNSNQPKQFPKNPPQK